MSSGVQRRLCSLSPSRSHNSSWSYSPFDMDLLRWIEWRHFISEHRCSHFFSGLSHDTVQSSYHFSIRRIEDLRYFSSQPIRSSMLCEPWLYSRNSISTQRQKIVLPGSSDDFLDSLQYSLLVDGHSKISSILYIFFYRISRSIFSASERDHDSDSFTFSAGSRKSYDATGEVENNSRSSGIFCISISFLYNLSVIIYLPYCVSLYNLPSTWLGFRHRPGLHYDDPQE